MTLENFVQNGKKIVGVAANYKALVKILQRPIPETPDIFLKPTTSYITEAQKIIIPQGFSVNEEIELGVIIGKSGKFITESQAMDHVGGYCVALDMTATCRMKEARSKGGSWTLGKGFDTACPVSKFIPKSAIKDPHDLNLWCKVNGELRQEGNTNDLIFSIPKLISFISQYITLENNDLIITGSPPGMGPVHPGDVIESGIENIINFKYSVSN
ncbi:acylpyruvase FAHD1, mitochondrial [Tribolium castaneum]|uniref:acylpyruvase FAHD1, mitochondrial n=1 Tax=Tribolium castaneum TaxID=7070 RepID=UPI0000D55701|nr:PREDICTED: acylpyruvase FAHD1, mitochondrial [Tribolium castaneum]|eukprot:XP_975403.1 PREDICTED: acylpyruvase FAHD1, mitochondrial [Tribolium castaneum]